MTTAMAPGPARGIDLIAQARAALSRPDVPAQRLRQHLAALLAVTEEALDRAEKGEHCPLTGLWTRDPWVRQATQMIATGRPTAILFIDLDDFKPINDTLGHATGDAILTAVATRLDTWCQHADGTAGRLGGDEFVLAVPATSWLATERAVLRDELAAPVEHGGRTLRVHASIGAALVEPGPEHTAAARQSAALHQADQAMYRDKATRRGGRTTDRRGRAVTADGAAPGPDGAAQTGTPAPAEE